MTTTTQKCYYCYQNKPNCHLVSWNKKTIAYAMGENTYLCSDCSYFLKVSEIMGKHIQLTN